MFRWLCMVLQANAAERLHVWVAFIASPGEVEILAAHGYCIDKGIAT